MKFFPSIRRISFLLVTGVLASQLAACSDNDGDSGGEGGAPATFPGAEAEAAAATYARIVLASYEDTLEEAKKLDAAVQALVDDPAQETLEEARAAWLASREPYLQTEVYRFYEGPIDNEDDGPEGMINAWPLDEAYIDGVTNSEDSGIINDTSVELSAENLAELNEQGGEANIATGYHAIEFLLWGQDESDDGPGDRSFEDYDTADNADRRGEYISIVSELLVTHLDGLVSDWNEDKDDNYRAEWEALDSDEAMRRMLTGMTILSGFETGGERLQTALDSRDQEDEHSCFSDNTHRDMIQDVQGVLNVWQGSYERLDGSVVEGASIRDAVLAIDADLAKTLDDQIADSLEKAEALMPPFDQELKSAEGQERIRDLIKALRAQKDSLEAVFVAFGLSVPVN